MLATMLVVRPHHAGLRGLRWGLRPSLALVLLAAVAACGDDFGEDPPPGPSDAEWSKSFGDEAAQTVTSVAMDELGGVYITGGFAGTTDFGGGPITAAGPSEDLFVAKLDTDGNHV